MKKCLIVMLASAFIGEMVPLIIMYIGNPFHTLKSMATYDYVVTTLWPSSLFLMLLDGPDRSRDGEILATSIFLNAVLYALIGLVVWFIAWSWKRWGAARN